jgi:hypothetical protein
MSGLVANMPNPARSNPCYHALILECYLVGVLNVHRGGSAHGWQQLIKKVLVPTQVHPHIHMYICTYIRYVGTYICMHPLVAALVR